MYFVHPSLAADAQFKAHRVCRKIMTTRFEIKEVDWWFLTSIERKNVLFRTEI